MKRAEQAARREAILAMWADCELVETISEKHEVSDSTVYRIARDYGQHIATRTKRGVEMKRAEKYAPTIVASYNDGASIDQIASQLGLQAREVRAAVYQAIQRGEIKAYASQAAEHTNTRT